MDNKEFHFQGGAKEKSAGKKIMVGVKTITPGNNGSYPFY
jgi:hypothetical protein